MNKYHIGLARLFWNVIEGALSCCVLKFRYRSIINDIEVNNSIYNDWRAIARDMSIVLEKVEGKYERREKKE